jgi:hypothetical protein
MINKAWAGVFAASILVGMQVAHSAVPETEAAALNSTLTPLGGERAGNASGTIPAWDGGLTTASGPTVGDIPANLFPDEKPVAQITAATMAEHADRLSPGTRALLKKYPDTFRLNVYPTHRTSAAPQWIYDNTIRNAKSCESVADGNSVKGCYGGIPFPIPKSGKEIVWNYLLRIEAEAIEYGFRNQIVSADGTRSLATRNDNFWNFPYYYQDGSAATWNGKYFLQRFSTTAPTFKVGESLVIHDSIDPETPRQAWQYLVGQRRVRRAPTVGYDTPDFVASGANYFDEVQGWFGAPDRYEWTIVGKQEMYIPYNNNNLVTADEDAAYSGHHFNPDLMRWELHRVWVVEANVAAGKRHAVPKRRLYFDEDTWMLALMDGYDSNDSLWRTSQVTPFVVPKIPATVMKPVIVFNLQANTSSTVQGLNGETYRAVPRKDDSFYTGAAVAAESMR